MNAKINKLLDELDQLKVSLGLIYADENFDEQAELACKSRIRSLDATIDYYLRPSLV